MSKIVSKALRFAPSASPDVKGYNLYWGPAEGELSYDSPKVNLGLPPTNADGLIVIPLNDVPEIATLPEGDYDFGVAAYDDVGNIATIQSVTGPLDLEAPGAVAGLELVDL